MILTFIDLDGTIEDSRQDMAAAAATVRKRLELSPRPEAELRALVNRGMDRLYRDCFPELFERAAMLNLDDHMALREAADNYAREYAARIVDSTRPYAGMPETLAALAAQGPLVCFTNKPEELSRILLDRLGLLGRFTRIMGGDSCAETKPSALPMRIAADDLNFTHERDQAIMIGDTNGDAAAAHAFGAKFIWCRWGYQSEAPERYDAAAEAPTQLPAILHTLCAP
jgi:phosphoglycolate phosphatase